MNLFKIFWKSASMTLSREMAYKFNFIVRTLTLLSFDLVMPLITILIYLSTKGFPGWSFEQILLFQGIFLIINSIDRIFFQAVDWTLTHSVRTGSFDRYLLYPMNTLAYLSFNNLNFEHLANLLIGIGLLVYSALQLNLVITFSTVLLVAAAFGFAALFIYSMAILRFAIIIRAVIIGRIGELFRIIKTFGEYPVSIYNKFLSSVFRYVIPLTVLSTIPSRVLLSNIENTMYLSFIAIFILFLLCQSFWNSTLKNYESAGG